MGKQTSYHPHRGPRQKQMPKGTPNMKSGEGMGMNEKSVGFYSDLGASQPKNRSLGLSKVKTISEKGL